MRARGQRRDPAEPHGHAQPPAPWRPGRLRRGGGVAARGRDRRRRRDPVRGRARRAPRQPAVLLPPADGGLHRAARRPALAAAELPARRPRALGAGAAGRLPRVARRARLPRRAARRAPSSPCASSSAACSRTRPTSRCSPERLERAYGEVESALYDGRTETVVIAPLLGVEIASPEVALGDGLTLVQGDAFPEDAPADALWAPGARRPHLLVVVRWEAAAGDTTPVAHARVRLRRLLTALRLYDGASVGFGPLAWTRTGGSPWQPFALGALGRRGEEPIVDRRRPGGRAARLLLAHRPAHAARAASWPGRCAATRWRASARSPARR